MKKIFLISLLAICVSIGFGGNAYAQIPVEATRTNPSIREVPQASEGNVPIVDRRRRYVVAQEIYQAQVETYRANKAELIEARERYKTMKNEEEKQRFEAQARVYLKSAIETFVHRAQRIVVWVDGNPGISAELQADVIQKLNAQIGELNTMLASIGSMRLEEITDLTVQIRTRIAGYNETVRLIVASIGQAQIETMWRQAEELLARFLNNIEVLEDKGIDMTKARELLISANSTLSGEKTKENVTAAYSDLRNLLLHLKQAAKLQRGQN